MSPSESAQIPLWVQGRDAVISNDAGVEWRYHARPDYSRSNENFRRESIFDHIEGSLEAIVQNLVRTFEMEASFKTNPDQWLSVVQDKFRMSTNGGTAFTAKDIVEAGTYNLFLGDTQHYQASSEDFESSAHIFHNTFSNGFLWELLEVLSGPPNVTFKWRHWGTFNGAYKDNAPTGQVVEIVGVSVARVTDDLKIESLEHYFDTNSFLNKLAAGCPFHSQQNSEAT